MENFSIELASSILNLEFQKEKLLNENKISNRLCSCRDRILKNFVMICQLFHIRVMSILIKFCEDFNKEKTLEFIDMRKWYYTEMYDKLFKKNCVRNKMILLLKILQHSTDEMFFKKFNNKFRKIILNSTETCSSDKFVEDIKELFEFIDKWMEEHILGIISLKLNCSNINDNILDDFSTLNLDRPRLSCKSTNCSDCSENVTCNIDKDLTEDIHIYITEDFIADTSICDFLNVISKYHKNTKDLSILLDFQFIESNFMIEDYMFEKYIEFKEIFKDIKFINCDRVYFGNYENKI